MKKVFLFFSILFFSSAFTAQTVPVNFERRLEKGCEHASFLKRFGFYSGRALTNALLKQSKVEIYKVQQSYDLSVLSTEIFSESLVFNELDNNTGNTVATDFKVIIDYLSSWKRKLKLKYPNREITDYTIANLDLDEELEKEINSEVTSLLGSLEVYYNQSMKLIRESQDRRSASVESDFQDRYKEHFISLPEKVKFYNISLNSVWLKISEFQKSVYQAEETYVRRMDEQRKKDLAEAAKQEEIKNKKDFEARQEQLKRISKFLEKEFFELPFEVQLDDVIKECKFCGKQCHVTGVKVTRPACEKNSICYDAWLELCMANTTMKNYLGYDLSGTKFNGCAQSARRCKERSEGDCVFLQIDRQETEEKWLFTPKGVSKLN